MFTPKTRVNYRVFPHHSHFKNVYMFYRRDKDNNKQYLTSPLQSRFGGEIKNVYIGTADEQTALYLQGRVKCSIIDMELFMAKAMSDITFVPLVIILRSGCEIRTKDDEYDIYYYQNRGYPSEIARSFLRESESI